MVITPDWVQDAIFYQIFPDRFAMSGRVAKPGNLEAWDAWPTTLGFKGGDLLGVAERLDYLQDLGVTAIYFTPIFQSAANHRYHTHDYYRIDPILGGDSAFRELLNAAHGRGIRVIIDGVFNHASRGFFPFNHILENGAASPYVDWFHIKGYPLHAYESKTLNYDAWWGLAALPKLNTRTPAVRDFIFDVAEYWMRQGADGWRLDVPGEIDDDAFWREFRRRVKAANPEAYIVGEIWHDAQRWLQGDQFDAVMNYGFTRACLGFFVGARLDEDLASGVGYSPVPVLDAAGFAGEINRLLSLYDPAIVRCQLNLLDSHDTARYLSIAKGDAHAFKLASLFQMTYPGAPSIYYGDEIGLPGGKDPDCRRAFPWDAPDQWNADLRQYLKDCIALRKRYRALRSGQLEFLHTEGMAVAYLRQSGDERLIVVLNAGPAADLNITVHDRLPPGARVSGVFGGHATSHIKDGVLKLHIGRREGAVLAID